MPQDDRWVMKVTDQVHLLSDEQLVVLKNAVLEELGRRRPFV